jgi:hypothetical protein
LGRRQGEGFIGLVVGYGRDLACHVIDVAQRLRPCYNGSIVLDMYTGRYLIGEAADVVDAVDRVEEVADRLIDKALGTTVEIVRRDDMH